MSFPYLLSMDSVPSLKSKRDHPGPDDFKRFDRNLHQSWKHAKSAELHGHGCPENSGMMNLSRLDKARSFAKKEAVSRNGAKSGSFASPNIEKRPEAGNTDRGVLERGEMQRSSSVLRKGHINFLKQNAEDQVLKGAEEDEMKGLSVSAFQNVNLSRGRPCSKHSSFSSDLNDVSTAPGHSATQDADRSCSKHTVAGHGDTSTEKSKNLTGIDRFKRASKFKTKHLSGEENSDASKDSNLSRIRVKEEKHLICSPSKSNNGSSGELSWKSSSSVRACKSRKPLLSSSEPINTDRLVAENPLPFLHVTRRARSERRRDDSCKSQSSKGVSLDGFGAELEEALLKKQEAEVNSGEQFLAGTQKRIVDVEANTRLSIDAGDASVPVDLSGTCKAVALKEADEREEGELEPEDDISEKHSSEVGSKVGNVEGIHMQSETTSQGCDELGDQKGFKEGLFECKQLHSESSRHNITLSAADGSNVQDLEVVKTQNVSKSDTIVNADVMNREEQKFSVNRICKRGLDDGRQDNGDLPIMDFNSSNLICSGSTLHAGPTGASLHVKGNGFPEGVDPFLSGELALHRTHGPLSNTHTIDEKHIDGNTQMQSEGGDNRDFTPHVEELDEFSVYGHKQKRRKVESLQLSLALPGCPSGSPKIPPKLIEHEVSRTHVRRGAESLSHLRTESMSNGFSASLSLSSFVHNPSCSLNCISHEDQELSCGGSRQISQGRWANSGRDDRGLCDVNKSATSLSKTGLERKPVEHQVFQNGKSLGFGAEFPSHAVGGMGKESNQAAQNDYQFASGHRRYRMQDMVQIAKSQAPSFEQKSISERSTGIEVKNLFNVKLGLLEISSEPIAAMAQKLQELPDSCLEGLKGLVKELLGSFAKREEFLALQQIIRARTDLTEDSLLRAHPTQLEILVALKTGMQSFVQQGAKTLTYKALIEIFLQTRCRNVDCQQILPVDGCECKVCSEKKGFCHECMCMVCSKFDSDSNTSRWVGCDLCMHWCHTDCGIRMSHIKSTRVSRNGVELSEMQFQCLSCDHYMELYGFVKDVFKSFATTWGAEILAKELDCVRRIFHSSEDARGKQLRWKAEEMLQLLERDVAVHDVCRSMLRFFIENDHIQLGKSSLVAPKTMQPRQVIDQTEGTNKAFATMGSIVARKLSNLVEDKELGRETVKKEGGGVSGSKDLPSIIGAKLTDVLMYQARADAAREDAINLQRIISFKAKKMEEDYSLNCAKLRLDAAEEQHRKCLEELQALEKSHHEYEIMKLRIESDMKHLMVKFRQRSKSQLASHT